MTKYMGLGLNFSPPKKFFRELEQESIKDEISRNGHYNQK